MKVFRIFSLFFLFILFLTAISAKECGLDNLGSCLAKKISEELFEFFLNILNSSIEPLVSLNRDLLTKPVNISIFSEIWAVIVYIISLFYGLLILLSGFRFIISGRSPELREKAKSELTNIIIMMILVQASFLLYSAIIELVSSLTRIIFNLINPNFFSLTYAGISNASLEIMLTLPYVLLLIITLIILVLRYICVSAGVILFAIGIFFYFIGILNQYGKLIINILFSLISLPFFYSIIFLTSSKLAETSTFGNMKILLMIGSFSLVILSTAILVLFVIIKASIKLIGPASKIAKVVSYLG